MRQEKGIFFKGITWCLLLALGISILPGKMAQAASTPKKPSFTVTKRTKTTATIKIKKRDTVTGYQVYVKKGKKGKYRLWTFSFTRTFKLKKLKAGSVYYVKMRAYLTRGLSIKKGKFSSAKKIKKYTKPKKKVSATTTPTPTPTPIPTPTTPSTSEEKYGEEVLALVNAERAKEGLSPLVLDKALNEAAMIRAQEIVEKFEHTRPDGSSCFTVLADKNISYRFTGENIAAGQSTPALVMNSWMNSEGHRANIMSSSFGKLGVGFVKASSGYQYYWVQLFTD